MACSKVMDSGGTTCGAGLNSVLTGLIGLCASRAGGWAVVVP